MKNKEIEKILEQRLHALELESKLSSSFEIMVERIEIEKSKTCLDWLDEISKTRDNPKLKDTVSLLKRRMAKHDKIARDLKYYEARCQYLELKLRSLEGVKTLWENIQKYYL